MFPQTLIREPIHVRLVRLACVFLNRLRKLENIDKNIAGRYALPPATNDISQLTRYPVR